MAKTTIRRKRGAVAEAKQAAAKLSPRDKKTMGSIVKSAAALATVYGWRQFEKAGQDE